MSLISFDAKKCTACGICSIICPENIIMPGESGVPSIHAEYEAFCVASECPTSQDYSFDMFRF
ncbi:hypothetical protein EO98_05345 [Methanosarcina sp. 2.H.T.1A.6]|uniref:4Fe-4S binding protein n=1 Tax=unclassified Methanosarcina TaxID=2644672 RepID=UPI0006212287|nr:MULTISPECIES: 4Fe-4S binding protein [unclassified Methanosarcina]KKG13536.1 hypothetical protein EO94_02090 [Methanosarcina sp. 2.H.T.1A.3]KKG15130.1 hypothetical protein EO97_17990 [Methanosarcina sp. 2.H.T.1A.15]KKG24828.1 hypothetical protein EO98_05345 [Methanosarcina sp. 2.H.T.1A.6]KKG26054.1 hypothetical protein EO96_16250 [Methanosarcina sp. 2.H.T.1A.8]